MASWVRQKDMSGTSEGVKTLDSISERVFVHSRGAGIGFFFVTRN
jgi:hypothetical protein